MLTISHRSSQRGSDQPIGSMLPREPGPNDSTARRRLLQQNLPQADMRNYALTRRDLKLRLALDEPDIGPRHLLAAVTVSLLISYHLERKLKYRGPALDGADLV